MLFVSSYLSFVRNGSEYHPPSVASPTIHIASHLRTSFSTSVKETVRFSKLTLILYSPDSETFHLQSGLPLGTICTSPFSSGASPFRGMM